MTSTYEQDERMAAIGRLLDAYGTDDSRWPAHARERLREAGRLMPEKVAALLAEARALDRVLAAAPAPAARPDAERRLADRIVAAALDAGPAATGARPSAEVVPLRQAQATAATTRPPARPDRWRNVAALLAASLLMGIILGGNVRLDPLLQDVAEAVGLPSVFGITTAALLDENGDEDAL